MQYIFKNLTRYNGRGFQGDFLFVFRLKENKTLSLIPSGLNNTVVMMGVSLQIPPSLYTLITGRVFPTLFLSSLSVCISFPCRHIDIPQRQK